MQRIKLGYGVSFLTGLLLGWLLIGWFIWPVAYVGDAYTYELNQADRLRYASAVVDSYASTGIADPAWFAQWTPEEVSHTLGQVAQNYPAKANWARVLGNLASQPANVYVQSPAGRVVQVQNQASEIDFTMLIWPAIGTIMVSCAGIGIVLILRKRNQVTTSSPTPYNFNQAFISRKTEEYIPVKAIPTSKLALISTHLTFGPNHPTDQHLPIERDGVAMGEFGVSQVEDLQAWDVWLFDPKALGTVTKVLSDERGTTLDGRGEFIAWKEPFTLETPNLKMTGMAVKQLEDGLRVDLTVEAKDGQG